MSTTVPASFAQFGRSLAFAEQSLTEVLTKHLALRGVEPGTWYALKLISERGPAVPREELIAGLSRSRTLGAERAAAALARLDADGLSGGAAEVSLTPAGEAFFGELRSTSSRRPSGCSDSSTAATSRRRSARCRRSRSARSRRTTTDCSQARGGYRNSP